MAFAAPCTNFDSDMGDHMAIPNGGFPMIYAANYAPTLGQPVIYGGDVVHMETVVVETVPPPVIYGGDVVHMAPWEPLPPPVFCETAAPVIQGAPHVAEARPGLTARTSHPYGGATVPDDGKSVRELLEECRRYGFDTKRCTDRDDLRRLLEPVEEAKILLGLDPLGSFTPEELRTAYHKAAKECHPDRKQNHSKQEQATKLFQKVKEAYKLLSSQ